MSSVIKYVFAVAGKLKFSQLLGLILVLLSISGFVLTLALAGAVGQQNVRIIDASNYASPLYGEIQSPSGMNIGYSENFTGWNILKVTEPIMAQLALGSNRLSFSGSIRNITTPTAAAVFKNSQIDIAQYPVLYADINVTMGISYGIRFFGTYPNGTLFDLWREGSALEHRAGKGLESINANIFREAFLATGRRADTLTGIEIYVESRANNPINFLVGLRKLTFSRFDFRSVDAQNDYRAVYIDLGNGLQENSSWSLNRIQFGLAVTAQSNTAFTLYLLDGYRLFSTIETPNIYQYYQSNPTYTVVYYPFASQGLFPEMLPRSNASIVLVANGGALNNVRLAYLNLIYLPANDVGKDPLASSPAAFFVYFIFFLFLLPVVVALLIYREFFNKEMPRHSAVTFTLITGLVCRFTLAPFFSHVFDMRVFLISARGWFQYGSATVSPGPTLPSTFFLYWIPYSFYALAQKLGFSDIFLPYHDAGIAESFFVKLFPIVADVIVFSILLKFRSGGKRLVFASFYFLNPIIIFDSSVRGHYDAASMALIVSGAYWISQQRIVRAASAFAISGILQLVGIVPYVLLLLRNNPVRRYKMFLPLLSVPAILIYAPERDLFFQLMLGISGAVKSQFSSGTYTLFGSLGISHSMSSFHPLLIVGGFLGTLFSFDAIKRRIQLKSIVFYTALAFVAFLLLVDEPYAWTWLVAIGILYAIVADNDNLPFFMLVSGTIMCFLVISYTTGFGYYIVGSNSGLPLPWTQNVRNGLEIFTVMTTILSLLFLAYLKGVRSMPRQTLIRSSALVLGLFILVYFWVGVYPL